MSLILNIDTAVQAASLCVARDGEPLALLTNPQQQDGAAWLHVALQGMMKDLQLELSELDAIAISAGPGSYTGLRVGMSAAKGLCYALQRPLITINTLLLMASSVEDSGAELLCPMIDARRMEVFTAVYDLNLNIVVAPTNMILSNGSFGDLLAQRRMLFFGNGSHKFKSLIASPNAAFAGVEATAAQMSKLSQRSFDKADFAPLAYTEPFYGKDFHSPIQ